MKQDLEFVSVIDGRVDINNLRNKQYGILRSGSQNTYKQFISNNFDNSQISWVATPPNQNTYVGRRMMITMEFQLNFTGQSAGPGITLLQASGLPAAPGVNPGTFQYDGPRAYPLSEAFKTLSVQMNNDNISTNLSSYARIMQRFNRDKDEEDKEYSLTPSMPDKSQSYDDLLGFPLNPLAGYGDNVSQINRGGFSGCTITRNDSTGLPGDQATVLMKVSSPCWLSPWAFGRNQEDVSFIQIQNINVQCTLGGRGNGLLTGLISSLWSHAPAGSVLSAASADVLSGTLRFNYISPDLTQQLPNEVTYSYFEPTLYPTGSNVAIAPGASTLLVMNNVQLNSVPNRMYVWASQRDQDINITSTNSYFRIDNVNITYNNQDGILSNMQIEDHYLMYLRNGGNMSFPQYSRYIGSVLPIGFGTDIPLDALSAPGLRSSQNLSLTLRVTNLSALPIVPTLNVLVIQEGVMLIRDQSVMRSVGVLDAVDIMNARSQTPISYRMAKTFHGAGFWDDVGGFFKKAFRPTLNAVRSFVPQQFQPIVEAVSDVGKSYGLGLGQRRLKGSALIGGEEMKQLTN